MPQKIIDLLTSSHRLMENVVTLIKVQIVMLKPGGDRDEPGFEFLKNAIGYMHNYPGLTHHPAEEILFDRLSRSAPHTRSLCRRLTNQHGEFAQRESNLSLQIDLALSGDLEAYRRIEEMGLAYCMEHAGHIDSEEQEAFPQAAGCLRPEDWREIGELALHSADPLTNREIKTRYDNLYDRLMAAGGNLRPN